MSSPLTRSTLEHLASLARIELHEKEEEKLLKDLGSIIAYFEELKSVETGTAPGAINASYLKNIFREDGGRQDTNRGEGAGSFPESKEGFLKIPNVFTEE